MTATLTQLTPRTTPTAGRTLHAFPPGSNISLCGRKLSPHPLPTMADTRHCPGVSAGCDRSRHPPTRTTTPMNLVTIGALAGIVALVLVLVIIL